MFVKNMHIKLFIINIRLFYRNNKACKRLTSIESFGGKLNKIFIALLFSIFLASCSTHSEYEFGINVNRYSEYFTVDYKNINNDRILMNHCYITGIKLPGSEKMSFQVSHLEIPDWGYRSDYPEINNNRFLLTTVYNFSDNIISINVSNVLDGQKLNPISKYYICYDSENEVEIKEKVLEYPPPNNGKVWRIMEIYKFPQSNWFYLTHSVNKWFKNAVQTITVKYYDETGEIQSIEYNFNLNWYFYQSSLESLWYI